MSTRSIPTTIIGPKRLLRDSLASLLGDYSYRVTHSHETTAEMTGPSEDGRMVLLTARTMEDAVAEAARVREICPDCKIVALPEEMPGEDFHLMARSVLDGCIPLQVSQEVLARTLDLVMSDSARIIVMTDDGLRQVDARTKRDPAVDAKGTPSVVPKAHAALQTASDVSEPTDEARQTAPPQLETSKTAACPLPIIARVDDLVRPAMTNGRGELRSPSARRLAPSLALVNPTGDCGGSFAGNGLGFAAPDVPLLSERERQIIEGLVKGQPNKTIARGCGITEATVKVHMKAILRKVPCSNRTQVAIWALGHAGTIVMRSGSLSPAE